jgi:DsbC/DsbD-like thiol-disulfide interchange protein
MAAVVLACIFAGGSERLPLAPGQPRKLEDVVHASLAASPKEANGLQNVVVVLEVAPGWHIFANPVGSEQIKDAETRITFRSGRTDLSATIGYPPGVASSNAHWGNFRIYEGRVVIPTRLRRGEQGPITVNVKLQACNDSLQRCIPGNLTLSLP